MIAMNARAELNSVAFDVIAREHLAGKGNVNQGSGFWAKLFGPDFWRLTGQHLGLVLGAVGLAVLIGVPLAVWVNPHPTWRTGVLGDERPAADGAFAGAAGGADLVAGAHRQRAGDDGADALRAAAHHAQYLHRPGRGARRHQGGGHGVGACPRCSGCS